MYLRHRNSIQHLKYGKFDTFKISYIFMRALIITIKNKRRTMFYNTDVYLLSLVSTSGEQKTSSLNLADRSSQVS